MRRGVIRLAAALACLAIPASLAAQSLNGQAEWVLDRAGTEFGGSRSYAKLFTQSYTVGYNSVIWDPRFMSYSAAITFYKSNFNLGGGPGDSNNFGYQFGANLFPQRPFALSVAARRTNGGYSGVLPGGDPISGALPLPPDYVANRFSTSDSAVDVGWQLNMPRWPVLAVNYHSNSVTSATGPFEATQKGRTFGASLEKSSARVRNTLTYDRTSDSGIGTLNLDRRQENLLYLFSGDIGPQWRTSARAGYRSLSLLSAIGSDIVNPGLPVIIPSRTGDSDTYYANGSVTYQPFVRLGFDASGGYDRGVYESGRRVGLDRGDAGVGRRARRTRPGPAVHRLGLLRPARRAYRRGNQGGLPAPARIGRVRIRSR